MKKMLHESCGCTPPTKSLLLTLVAWNHIGELLVERRFTVQADGPIKPMTFITEYVGNVDYVKNREEDECDSLMTLLVNKDASSSLLICLDKRANIARFISGINNRSKEGNKKKNLKSVRYSVHGECRVSFLVAIRHIGEGERLYYNYNG